MGGGGVCKTKNIKEMYEAKLEFSEGWRGGGSLKKISSVGKVWMFSGTTHTGLCVSVESYFDTN